MFIWQRHQMVGFRSHSPTLNECTPDTDLRFRAGGGVASPVRAKPCIQIPDLSDEALGDIGGSGQPPVRIGQGYAVGLYVPLRVARACRLSRSADYSDA
jgi:hypothetical protein